MGNWQLDELDVELEDLAVFCRWNLLVHELDGRQYRCGRMNWRGTGLCEAHAGFVIATAAAGEEPVPIP